MERVQLGGPWFEDFYVGQVFADAPALTLTAGHAALHQAVFGDRLRLPLDVELCRSVTGSNELLANPSLVCNVAVGQTTGPSQRVRANLFYRGLVLLRPVFLGDTLRTRTQVVGLKQNKVRPGKPATGLVALAVRVENQHGEAVLDFWRCPMIPMRDPSAETGHADSFDAIPADIDPERVAAAVPSDWKLDIWRELTPGPHFADLAVGSTYQLESTDVVSSAPELARMTLNIAAAHHDNTASAYQRRLVYGGHTISMAAAHVVRALPSTITVLAWRECDHTGPVFEGDALSSQVTIEGLHPLPEKAGRDGVGLVELHVVTSARSDQAQVPEGVAGERPVLDWRLFALV